MQKNFYKPKLDFIKPKSISSQTEYSQQSSDMEVDDQTNQILTQVEQSKQDELTQEEKREKLRLMRIKNLEISRQKKKEKRLQTTPLPVTKQIEKNTPKTAECQSNGISLHRQREQNKIKNRWNDNCKILTLSIPQKIPAESTIKSKAYAIQFRYRDEKGTIHEATVKFGSTDGKDFIQSKQQQDKQRNHSRFSQITNPLDPNYWRFWICNTEETLTKAYCEYLIRNSIY